MKSLGKKLLIALVIGAVVLLASTVVLGYFDTRTITFDIKYITNGKALLATGAVFILLLLFWLFKLADGKSKKPAKPTKVIDERGAEVDQFFNRDFVTEADLKKVPGFNYNNLQSIRSSKKDGILVRAEERGNNMEINFVTPIHTLVVGTTSSGKTQRFVVPSLQLMSMTQAKPSFIVTDPKGELYNLNANKLTKEGYDVRVLNLRDPAVSIQWNPLTYPFDMYTRSFNLDKEVKVHSPGDDPSKYNLKIQRQFDYRTSNWFEFDNTAYVDRTQLETEMRIKSNELRDMTNTAVQDICTTLAPVESAKDPSWEKTARRLIQAVITAMLEDSRIPELGLTRDKFNFYNVYKICNITDNGRDTYATLKKYLFEYRDKFSKVPDLASTALQNAESTTKNYMGFVSSMVALFADGGISFLTEKTEVDFVNIDERPTAVFLIIPDEIRTRYPLAILFVTQLYKRLVDKATGLGGELKRHVYFLLDEFGNMPKFPEFGSIMTVGRSRGIFFELCVQSYSQLYQVYGQDEGKIIKDNCPIQVYIASEDMTTNKEFSELLGKKTVVLHNENRSKGPDGKDNKSESDQTLSIPIAYPEQLMSFRDENKVVIKTFTPNAALKNIFTYAWQAKCYDLSKVYGTYQQRRTLDEESVYYDIKIRNDYMQKLNGGPEGSDDDDFDDLF